MSTNSSGDPIYPDWTLSTVPASTASITTSAVDTYITATPSLSELKSNKSADIPTEHSHHVQCTLVVEGDHVAIQYSCQSCKDILHRKVISRIPKSIIKKKCLSRIIDGV